MAENVAQTEQLNYIRVEIRAEIDLLNHRLNALMASLSFLVIAYSSALSSGYMAGRVPGRGVAEQRG